MGKIYKLKNGISQFTYYDYEVPPNFQGILTKYSYTDITNDTLMYWIQGAKQGFWIPLEKLEECPS